MSAQEVLPAYATYVGSALSCVSSIGATALAPPAVAAALLTCGGAGLAQLNLINTLGCLSAAADRSNPDACLLTNRLLAEAGEPTIDELPEDRRRALAEGARLARQQLINSWREAIEAHRPWVSYAQNSRNQWRAGAVVAGVAAVGLLSGAVYMAVHRDDR